MYFFHVPALFFGYLRTRRSSPVGCMILKARQPDLFISVPLITPNRALNIYTQKLPRGDLFIDKEWVQERGSQKREYQEWSFWDYLMTNRTFCSVSSIHTPTFWLTNSSKVRKLWSTDSQRSICMWSKMTLSNFLARVIGGYLFTNVSSGSLSPTRWHFLCISAIGCLW